MEKIVTLNKESFISNNFNKQVFLQTGVFIIKNAIPNEIVKRWKEVWDAFYEDKLKDNRDVNKANPVALKEELPEELLFMYREKSIIELAKQVLGEDVALYNHRFVIKDKFSLDPVFLHQDSCYHLGNLEKCSFFVPLSTVTKSNGGLTFYLGSHKCGYLGDAGEINPDGFDFKWPTVTPDLDPGDVVVMNSLLWHESGPNQTMNDRILADMILQPANDPTGKELLSGTWKTDFFYSPSNPIRYFRNSRVLKIIKYENELKIKK